MIRVLTLSLALLIAVTSQQMAVARGLTHDAAGQVVLCTGQGVVTVTLDRNGDPIGTFHICPDCAVAISTAPLPPVVADAAFVHIHTLAQTPVVALHSPTIHRSFQPRGPPQIV